MALLKELIYKGVTATYHRVVELNVDARDRSDPQIAVLLAFYASKAERDSDGTPLANSLGLVRVFFRTSGVTYVVDNQPSQVLDSPEDKAAVEAFILAHVPNVYQSLKMLPLYKDAQDG